MIEDRLPDIIEMSKFLLSVEPTPEQERIMEDNLEEAYWAIKECIILLLSEDEEEKNELATKLWDELRDDIKELSLAKAP